METQKRCGDCILSYLNVRSWHTYSVDKTTAPHRYTCIIAIPMTRLYANDAGAIVNHLHAMIKLPSSTLEDNQK